MKTNPSKELLKGTLTTIILRLLSEKGKMYGYELAQCVKETTDGKVLIKEGSLYPALHKLEADGLIECEKVMIGKRVRKYYHLTPAGETATAKAINELLEFLSTIHHLITTEPIYGNT
ncbi:PadR family transcriptional regulator [Bernardetia sp. ABR2-2B]|uniref:PadR family transcriptional regulator n=1 Tax=Bernardetia sp. ABR2-2B TaxID=3127472 RepID=UPI0030D202D5